MSWYRLWVRKSLPVRAKFLLLLPLVFLLGIGISFVLPKKKLLSPLSDFQPNLSGKLAKKISTLNLVTGGTDLASLSAIPHYLVFNLDTGTVYAARGEKEKISPASFTKYLSGQIALDLGYEKQLLTATKNSVNKVPTILGLRPGEQLTLTDLLRASIATSGNDAATTLAEGVASQNGLTLADFVDLMNQKAKLLGMTESRFANADGLDDPNQFSTLLDVAKLVANTYKEYPEIASASGSDRVDILPEITHGRYYLPNWNGLLGVYPGVFGGKIAYTENAGYGTIVLAQRQGIRLVVILSGADSIPERDLAAAALLDAGFIAEKISPVNLRKNHLVKRYKEWSDLAKQIRSEMAAQGLQ